MHESCVYDIVGERTGETVRVLKVSYNRVTENKYARLKKKRRKKKENIRELVPRLLHFVNAQLK